MSGWGNLFGKIADQFQGRTERLKNEKERLENERRILMSGKFSVPSSRRVTVIDDRLREISKILINAAS